MHALKPPEPELLHQTKLRPLASTKAGQGGLHKPHLN